METGSRTRRPLACCAPYNVRQKREDADVSAVGGSSGHGGLGASGKGYFVNF